MLGRPLALGTRPVTPVAVAAPGAGFPSEAIDAWIRWEDPPAATPEGAPAGSAGPDTRSFRYLVRLAPVVSWEPAREDARRVFREIVGPPPKSLKGAPVLASAGSLAAAVRREVREAAPAVPIPAVRTLEEEMARSIGDRRLRAVSAVGFAAVALAVALTGVAALFLRAAAERRHEMAVRMALGATGGRIVATMLRGALAVTGAGLVAGLAAAALFTTGLRGLLFGVGPHDPATRAAVVLAVAAACLLAAWLPAHRAARVQPAELLRGE